MNSWVLLLVGVDKYKNKKNVFNVIASRVFDLKIISYCIALEKNLNKIVKKLDQLRANYHLYMI